MYLILLENHKAEFAEPIPEIYKILETNLAESIVEVYKALGGRTDPTSLESSSFDLQTSRFTLQLDEALHFNRYRLITLKSSIYDNLYGIDVEKYRMYCRKYEKECLKSGASKPFWSNKLAIQHFGHPEDFGDLSGNGAPGWKLLAFQEFLKDAFALQNNIKLMRIPIWEEIMFNKQLQKLKDLLLSPGQREAEVILNLIDRKLIRLYHLD